MKIAINASSKKSGTTYLHRLIIEQHILGANTDPLKEYYIFPRNSPNCNRMASEVLENLASRGNMLGVPGTLEQMMFLTKLLHWCQENPRWCTLKMNEATAKIAGERLRFLVNHYDQDVFIVSDPNFLDDIYDNEKLLHKFIEGVGYSPTFFSVYRNPSDIIYSYLLMTSTVERYLSDYAYAVNVTKRFDQITKFRWLYRALAINTPKIASAYKVYSFDYLTGRTRLFLESMARDFGILTNPDKLQNTTRNPNPGKKTEAGDRLKFKSRFDIVSNECSLEAERDFEVINGSDL